MATAIPARVLFGFRSHQPQTPTRSGSACSKFSGGLSDSHPYGRKSGHRTKLSSLGVSLLLGILANGARS